MENPRYDFSPIVTREPFELPNQARVAVYVAIAIECWAFDAEEWSAPGVNTPPPNLFQYAPRDYGNRIGLWRIMEVLDKHNIKATGLFNSDVCELYPYISDACNERDWDFVAHSTSNAVMLAGKSPDEERAIIRKTLDVINNATQQRPIGWIGAALAETFDTPDILAEEGVKYVSDWVCDDQPFPMNVKSGHLISMPYSLDINDIPAFIMQGLTPKQFYEMIVDQFDTLYREGAGQARVMSLCAHPFLMGQPYRIAWLDRALEYMKGFDDVWFTTSGAIARWYYEKYLDIKLP